MRNVFGFLQPEQVSGELVFPTLSGTLYDYWRSDLGVTEQSGTVKEWEGQSNGNILISGSTGGPTVSGSNAGFNNLDTLTFDGSSNGMGKNLGGINGANTGSICMSIYAAPHGDGGNWGAIFGITTDGNSPFPSEAVMRAQSTSQIALYGYPPGQTIGSNDDTYGKGIYHIAQGNPTPFGTQGARFFNKNNSSQNAEVFYTPANVYENADQPFALGAYNPLNNADLFGKVDIAGVAIWTNPTDVVNDFAAIDNYFQQVFGT